jgi:NAD(P)-dependent dehydrogenase (short-subunit alcohol dehydrogenase family)
MAETRAILVTGGANGLGAAMVRHFTAAGQPAAPVRFPELALSRVPAAGT